jgi:hypothetical protein
LHPCEIRKITGVTMAVISIPNLRPSGADLFEDSESYLQALDDNELDQTTGGATPAAFALGFAVSVYGAKQGWW